MLPTFHCIHGAWLPAPLLTVPRPGCHVSSSARELLQRLASISGGEGTAPINTSSGSRTECAQWNPMPRNAVGSDEKLHSLSSQMNSQRHRSMSSYSQQLSSCLCKHKLVIWISTRFNTRTGDGLRITRPGGGGGHIMHHVSAPKRARSTKLGDWIDPHMKSF